ncbi:ATP-grasp domain-containing protein [Gaetbulibacter sp. M235]|uniref:ATP-grasp domain-containing protein n=1 Tax=Gaetbulibacter sp. M235 TaxID=3126510 RepID=UPI00374EA268
MKYKINKNQISVLLPETSILNFTTVVVNCLSEQKNINIYVISNFEFPELRHSNKISNFSYYPKTKSESEWLTNIEKELKKFSIDFIIPIDVYSIKTLIKNRNNVSFSNKIGLLPDFNSFNIANDKSSLAKHMLKNNIPFPKTFHYSKEELLENIVDRYPILIKPITESEAGEGIVKFNDFNQLKSFLLNNELSFSYIIQKYIVGYDIDCSVLCEKGKIVVFTIQKGILSGKTEFGPNNGVEFLYAEKLYRVVEKLMKTLNWSGVAHVDLRYDMDEDSYKVIEINPRFWSSLDASLAAGINFPYIYLLKSLNIDFVKPMYNHIKFLNLLGLMKTIRNNKLFIFNLRFIMKYTTMRFYLKDALPFVYLIYNKFRNS